MLTPHMHTHIQRWVSGLGIQKRLRRERWLGRWREKLGLGKMERERGEREREEGRKVLRSLSSPSLFSSSFLSSFRSRTGDKRWKRCVCAGRETDWCETERVCVCVCEGCCRFSLGRSCKEWDFRIHCPLCLKARVCVRKRDNVFLCVSGLCAV